MNNIKDILISNLKKQGIGLIERHNEKAPLNRRWSLEFYPLNKEDLAREHKTINFTTYEKGTFIPIEKAKIYSDTKENLYGSKLVVALGSYLNSITIIHEIPIDKRDLLSKKCEFISSKLFDISLIGMKSLQQAILTDAITNG